MSTERTMTIGGVTLPVHPSAEQWEAKRKEKYRQVRLEVAARLMAGDMRFTLEHEADALTPMEIIHKADALIAANEAARVPASRERK